MRRFLAAIDLTAEHFELSGNEARHLLRVLRIKPGERVLVFDGAGLEVLAEIVSVTDETAQLRVIERHHSTHESSIPLTIATAVPKGDRFSWLIEKLTELGVHRVIPLITQRSIVDPGQGKLDKLRRTIVEASKQCGRATLMELTQPIPWSACVAQEFPKHAVYMAHPGGTDFNWSEFRTQATLPQQRPPLFLIGPEGGFTDSEVEQTLDNHTQLVALGPRILRIETAAIAAAVLASLQ